MADHVDFVLAQWAEERPDLDVSGMGVFGRLNRLITLVSNATDEVFAVHGLDRSSADVLFTLRRSGPPYRLTPSELVHAAMKTSGAITQRLDRLEARGLVRRARSETDGRGVVVSLTRDGLTLTDRVLPDHVDNYGRLLAGLTPPQQETLARLLRKLLESLGDDRDRR